MTAVSLILATVGRVDELRRCLDSLKSQSSRDFEVLIIDQNEDDRLMVVVENARQAGLDLRHLRLYPPSLSDARNLGVSEAVGAVVGFPDDDCRYEQDVIQKIIRRFSDNEWISGGVACWVEQAIATGQSLTSPLLLAQWRQFRDTSGSSITLFFRRSILLCVGGFDRRLGVGCWYGAGEETDLVLRVLAEGGLIERIPEARVHHTFGNSESGALGKRFSRIRARSRGVGALYAKHRFDMSVVLRGMMGPLFHALVGRQHVVTAIAACMGRLEGYMRWRIEELSPP